MPTAPKANAKQSSTDIEEKLETMRNKWKSKKSKPSERTIKKREQKKLKKSKEFKKKIVSIAKSTKNEKVKEEKSNEDSKEDVKAAVVYNEEGKMVFPKFEFAAQKSKAKKSKKDKVVKNPKLILKTIKKQRKEIEELKERGDVDEANKITNDLAWQKAFDKVEGKKVIGLILETFFSGITPLSPISFFPLSGERRHDLVAQDNKTSQSGKKEIENRLETAPTKSNQKHRGTTEETAREPKQKERREEETQIEEVGEKGTGHSRLLINVAKHFDLQNKFSLILNVALLSEAFPMR